MLATVPEGLGQLPWLQRAAAVLATLCIEALWIKLVVARLRPGLPRLLAALPVLATNLYTPFVFHQTRELLSRLITAYLLLWLASFKLLALVINRGPLNASRSVAAAFFLYAMPIYPRPEGSPPSKGGWQQLLGRWLLNMCLLVGMAFLLSLEMPRLLLEYVFTVGLYAFNLSLMDGPASLMTGLLGIELLPSFDVPWISQSASEFWAKRWNIATGHLLRTLCYDPLMEGRLIGAGRAKFKALSSQPKPQAQAAAPPARGQPGARSDTVRLLGGCLTFLLSGLAHEVVLLLVSPGYRFGYWCSFFVVQAPVVWLEALARRWGRDRGLQKLPALVGVLYTTSVLMLAAHLFWFPPILDHYDLVGFGAQAIKDLVG